MQNPCLLSVKLTIVIGLLLHCFGRSALGAEEAGFIYEVNATRAVVTGYTGFTNRIQIPDRLGGKPVTEIGFQAFEHHGQLTEVLLPDTVLVIGERAFNNSGLRGVSLPTALASIGEYAFADCIRLTNAFLPATVTTIGSFAFSRCESLRGVNIPSTVKRIGTRAFQECTSLQSVTLHSGISELVGAQFAGCTALESVTLQPGLRKLNAFADCARLTDVSLPDTLTEIGGFQNCSSLKSIKIYEVWRTTVAVTDGAFAGCTELTDVTLPYGTQLGMGVFARCSKLTGFNVSRQLIVRDGMLLNANQTRLFQYAAERSGKCVIPGTVVTIDDGAFEGCAGLTEVSIPGSVTRIGSRAFAGCTSLSRVALPPAATSIGSLAFQGCTNLTTVTLPENLPGIPDGLFSGCTRLASAAVPIAVTSIGSYAFAGCTSLKSVALLELVTTINAYAFSGCTALTSVSLPSGLTWIWDSAFAGCSGLTSFFIPRGVKVIGSDALVAPPGAAAFAGCSRLTRFDVDPANSVFTSADGVLVNKAQTKIVQFPGGKAGPYVIPPGITAIGFNAFAGCRTLASIRIPVTVTNIETGAFSWCTNLTRIEVDPENPANYRSIDGVLFKSGLLIQVPAGRAGEYVIPGTMFHIPRGAFAGCSRLTRIRVAPSVSVIFKDAFAGCTELHSVTIPAKTRSFMDGAFAGCTALRSIFFEGPQPGDNWDSHFSDSPAATAYHLPDIPGWGVTFGGRPTSHWLLALQAAIGTGGAMELKVSGAEGQAIVLESAESLADPIWTPRSTNVLAAGGLTITDSGGVVGPRRYYRVTAP